MQPTNLLILNNNELMARMQSQRHSQLEFLVYLAEADARKLHVTLGFDTLADCCVEVLGLSEGMAHRKIITARAARQYPTIYTLIAHGETHCRAIALVWPHLTPDNADHLLEQIRCKSRHEIAQIIAALTTPTASTHTPYHYTQSWIHNDTPHQRVATSAGRSFQ